MEQGIDLNLLNLKEEIKHLDYVVMRNWETMPPLGDIDFYVSSKHRAELLTICQKYLKSEWYDIRTEGDGYYPRKIELGLLFGHEHHDGWKIPVPWAHFDSLYYHQRVHKGDHRYDVKLDEIFFKENIPVEPLDTGVEFHHV